MGTLLRHISAKKLLVAEAALELLPFKVEVKSLTFTGGLWFVHFTVDDKDPRTKKFKSGKVA